jgi:hypothetical protein
VSTLREAIGVGLILGAVHGFLASPADAYVTPTFTTGTVNSHTESTTTVTETIHQIDYQTGWTYTVTGTNINIPGNPALGMTYQQVNSGEPFQFSESYFGPGQSRETFIERTTTIESVTDSLSVFTQ